MAMSLVPFQCRSAYETERDLLVQLRHPNVVQLLATCEDEDESASSGRRRSLVLELMGGGSLRGHLDDATGPMEATHLIAVAADLAAALVHLHSLERPVLVRKSKSFRAR